MLPVVRGEAETRRQILLYSVLLYAVTQLPFCAGGLGDDLPRRLARARRRCSSAAPWLLQPPRRPALGAAPVPLLARLPGPAVRRDGRRRQALGSDQPRTMDRNLARKNVRTGLIVTAVCFFMFGMTFVAAAIYSLDEPARPRGPARRRGDPPPRRQHPAGAADASASRVALVGVTTTSVARRSPARSSSSAVIVALDPRHAPRHRRAPARAPRALERAVRGRSTRGSRGGHRISGRRSTPPLAALATASVPRAPGGRATRPRRTARCAGHVADRAVVGPAAHDVAHREQAGDSPPLGDDEVAEAAADHRDGGLLERPVGRGEDDVGREVVGDALGVGVLARGRSSRGGRAR